MKNLILALIVLSSFGAADDKKVNPAEYPIAVHVTSSSLNSQNGGCGYQKLSVVLDGKKYVLQNYYCGQPRLILPGHYKAKIVSDDRPDSYSINRQYELLFTDNKTKRFTVAGVSE